MVRAKVPHKGWVLTGIINRREENQEPRPCEMCEGPLVVHAHQIAHAEQGLELEVGGSCAGRLTEEYTNRRRSRTRRGWAKMRAKWPFLRSWRTLRNGQQTILRRDFRLCVWADGPGGWRVSIDAEVLLGSFQTEGDAKMALFDSVYPEGIHGQH